MRERPGLDRAYRIAVGVVGAAMLIVGILLVPYPGPGWLVVFAGLGVWATEFHWARQVLRFVRKQYNRWTRWLRRQPRAVQLIVMALVGAVVLATLWLVNAFGLVADWVGLNWPWVHSPLK